MEKIFEKLDSYNIFTNLIPGCVLVKLLSLLGLYNIQIESAVAVVVLYYFFGVVASRIGSLIIEKVLLLCHIVKYAPRAEYIKATHKDNDIKKLLESSNMYRTFAGVFFLLLIAKAYQSGMNFFNVSANVAEWISIVLLFLLFVFSFIKQTKNITKRVAAADNDYNVE